eukprot:TRINITY_DN15212_c0_g1_i1.p1 TRINITY_DN15212_c0_g1~~TRINITY_DN15212_c0_g1_i1.p1  ORF type:complete len:125 (+),score=12.91 TRINITY_DN15212_c0_g1_i1:473-847(+)
MTRIGPYRLDFSYRDASVDCVLTIVSPDPCFMRKDNDTILITTVPRLYLDASAPPPPLPLLRMAGTDSKPGAPDHIRASSRSNKMIIPRAYFNETEFPSANKNQFSFYSVAKSSSMEWRLGEEI